MNTVAIDKTGFSQGTALLVVIVSCVFSLDARSAVFNLAADWSDSNNPNGVWSYNDGAGPITNHVDAYIPAQFENPQPAWANATSGPGHIPSWLKSVNNGLNNICGDCINADFLIGDVVSHTWDGSNGGIAHSNVSWTSPGNGVIDITGAVWLARNIGRAVNWSLQIKGLTVSGGSLFDGDAFSRANPFDLGAGSGGASILDDIRVVTGDQIALFLITDDNSTFGEFTGVNLQVELTSGTPQVAEPNNLAVTCIGLLALAFSLGR